MSLQRTSKYISLILRHKPETIGITMDEHGWAKVDELIEGINRSHPLTMETLERGLHIIRFKYLLYTVLGEMSIGAEWWSDYLKPLYKTKPGNGVYHFRVKYPHFQYEDGILSKNHPCRRCDFR